MKKYSIIMSVLLVLALSVPAFGALNWSGSMETQITYTRPGLDDSGTVSGSSFIDLNATLTQPSGAHIGLHGVGRVDKVFGTGAAPVYGPFGDLAVNYAWFTIVGPFRTDGQQLTTTLGDFDIGGNNWRSGIRITGIKLGDTVDVTYRMWPGTTQIMSTIPGDPLSGNVNINHIDGDIDYNANATLKATDDVTLTGQYNSVGSTYKFTGTVAAADNVTLYGEVDHNQAYKVQGTIGLVDAPFTPTIIAGYEKTAADDTGFYGQADVNLDVIRAQLRYNDLIDQIRLCGGTDTIYDYAATGNAPNPWHPDGGIAGRTGYVAIYNKVGAASDVQFATRFDLGDVVDLGVAPGTTVTARANMITDLDTGDFTTAKVGAIIGTTVSAAGFDNINLSASFTQDTVIDDSEITLTGSYTAPNGIAFTGSRADDGTITVTAKKTVSF